MDTVASFGSRVARIMSWGTWARLLPPTAIFLCALVCLAFSVTARLNLYDEGIILTGAEEVIRGLIPHRDFYANYGPGQFYVVGGLFEVFGRSYLVERLYDIVLRAVVVVVVYTMLARRGDRAIAVGAAVLATLWLQSIGSYGYPTLPVLFLALLATDWLAPPDGEADPIGLVCAGGLVGLSALFRYDMGFVVMCGQATVIALSPGNRLGRLISYIAGVAVVFVPAFSLLLLTGALHGFIADVIGQSSFYTRTRALPLPDLSATETDPVNLAIYLPFGAFVVGAAWIGALNNGDKAFAAQLVALVGTLVIKGLVRPSLAYMTVVIVPAIVLLAFLASRELRVSAGRRALLTAVAITSVVPLAYQLFVSVFAAVEFPEHLLLGRVIENKYALKSLLTPVTDEDVACGASVIARVTNQDEAIFVDTGRNDKIYANDISVYYMTNRRPGTHWYHFDPGLQTRSDIQREVKNDLIRSGDSWIFRDTIYDGKQEPNASRLANGAHLLDDYLSRAYRPVFTKGRVSLWLRDDERAPPGMVC